MNILFPGIKIYKGLGKAVLYTRGYQVNEYNDDTEKSIVTQCLKGEKTHQM